MVFEIMSNYLGVGLSCLAWRTTFPSHPSLIIRVWEDKFLCQERSLLRRFQADMNHLQRSSLLFSETPNQLNIQRFEKPYEIMSKS